MRILAILFLILIACNPAKKIERDDQKAVSRVNAKLELQIPVVNEWLKSHPQQIKTETVTVPGPEIKIPYPVLIKDTAHERKLKDSLHALINCGEAASNAYDMGWDEAEKYFKTHPITIKCPDYQKETITDLSVIGRLADSLNKKNVFIGFLSGQESEKDAQIRSLGKRVTGLWWLIVGMGALLAVSAFFNIKGIIPGVAKKAINV